MSGVPAISVVMAAYNGTAWLPETLGRLAAQSFADFEVLVVDDGSADGTRDLLAAWPDRRVRCIPMGVNGGPVLARNRGVAEARGRYIAALDQDDLCAPERLARQVAYLEAHPGTVLVGTQATILQGGVERPSDYPAVTSPALIDWLLAIENPLVWSSVMLRAEAARSLAPFSRPELLYAEDFDIYQRLRAFGALARLDEPLVAYRVHAGGISKVYAARMRSNAARVLAMRNRDALGDEAEAAAALLVAHVTARDPVPDAATLAQLASILVRLQAHWLATTQPSPADRQLVLAETARRWARIGRAALRCGHVGLGALAAATPPALGDVARRPLLASALIGSVRRGRQTLAAKIIRPVPSRANT